MKKTKLIQLVSVFAILIIPSLFYVILTAGEHDIARLSFYGPEGIGESGIGEGANDSIRYELDPSIKFQTSTGDSSSFGDLRENILVIHFFCTDCSQESDRVITQIQELALKFEDKEDVQSKKELEQLEQLYTLGDVNFDSVIIIDFGNNLKSVLTSLVYTDVNQDNVLFTTINQWFDESIFYENTIQNLYYPSVNYKEYKKYNEKYFERFKIYPNEITILTYDALGLIYFAWKKNNGINSVNGLIRYAQSSLNILHP